MIMEKSMGQMKGEVMSWPPERERVWACALLHYPFDPLSDFRLSKAGKACEELVSS